MAPHDEINIDRKQREEARWIILRTCDAARPMAARENQIARILADVALGMTERELRRELTYLAEKQLLSIPNLKAKVWHGSLTAYGIDVVEYTKDAPPGIDRPSES